MINMMSLISLWNPRLLGFTFWPMLLKVASAVVKNKVQSKIAGKLGGLGGQMHTADEQQAYSQNPIPEQGGFSRASSAMNNNQGSQLPFYGQGQSSSGNNSQQGFGSSLSDLLAEYTQMNTQQPQQAQYFSGANNYQQTPQYMNPNNYKLRGTGAYYAR